MGARSIALDRNNCWGINSNILVEVNGNPLVNCLPIELLNNIFSFLSLKDYGQASQTCLLWHNISRIYLPEGSLAKDVRDDFLKLVNKSVLTWKEVPFFTQLSPFSAICEQKSITYGLYAAHENYEIRSCGNGYYMRLGKNWFIKYGSFCFWINSLKNINFFRKAEKLLREGENMEIFTLDNMYNYETIAAIQVEGNYIFALRYNGTIDQWNYITKKLINSFTLKHGVIREPFAKEGFFLVKDGKMIFNTGITLKIIHYDLEDNPSISFASIQFSGKHLLTCVNNTVFLGDQNEIITQDEMIYKTDPGLTIQSTFIQNEYCYALISSNRLVVINLINKKTISLSFNFSLLNPKLISKITAVNNFLFMFHHSKKDSIFVVNLNTSELIREFSFHVKWGTEPRLLETLVQSVKTYSQPLTILEALEGENESFRTQPLTIHHVLESQKKSCQCIIS